MFNIHFFVCFTQHPLHGISLLATPHLNQLPDGSKVGAVPALRRQISCRVDGRQQNVLAAMAAGQAPKITSQMSRTGGNVARNFLWMVKWLAWKNPRTIKIKNGDKMVITSVVSQKLPVFRLTSIYPFKYLYSNIFKTRTQQLLPRFPKQQIHGSVKGNLQGSSMRTSRWWNWENEEKTAPVLTHTNSQEENMTMNRYSIVRGSRWKR